MQMNVKSLWNHCLIINNEDDCQSLNTVHQYLTQTTVDNKFLTLNAIHVNRTRVCIFCILQNTPVVIVYPKLQQLL